MKDKPVLEIYDPGFRNFNVKYQYDLRKRPPADSIGLPIGSGKFSLIEGLGIEDVNFDGTPDENDINYLSSANIVGYNIKGLWYFDKKYGELRYRLIGIQPVGYEQFKLDVAMQNYNMDIENGKEAKKPTPVEFFWLWYKDIREEIEGLGFNVVDYDFSELPEFTDVLIFGLLHHLNDKNASRLIEKLSSQIKEGGKLVAIDPLYVEENKSTYNNNK